MMVFVAGSKDIVLHGYKLEQVHIDTERCQDVG
ncbi:hypothetical protein GGD55_003642 [Rhizobium giardinii]|uniref:Uncharacterized protein n=1 Tax=Rhizobium giardinii TaxID=56731 RepID=A0A7W8X9S4_9HYPH|nr:hypothetical protein [Rhizobium giardinii]